MRIAFSLAGVAQASEDLSRRARSKRLSADELRGGTFTISNPGRNGNLYGFAIINQPQMESCGWARSSNVPSFARFAVRMWW